MSALFPMLAGLAFGLALSSFPGGQEAAPPLDYADFTGAIASLGLDGGPTEVEIGDLNGDGCPDLVSVGDHGSPLIGTQQHGVTVWLGDCAGGWILLQTGNFGYGGVALGDADGDGLIDVGYGVHHDYSSTDLGDQLLEVALGDGSGGAWTPWDDGLATHGETYGMFGTDFGDVDGDGDLDLGSNSFGCCAGVHVYLNQGNGTWAQSFGFLGGNSDHTFEFADFNGDGHLDIATGNSIGRAWLGDGQGGFQAADGNLPSGKYFGIATGDLNADGRDELCTTDADLARVWSWSPGNAWVELTGNLTGLAVPMERIDLVDMNRDGSVDLVGSGEGLWGVYWTNGQGLWRRLWAGPMPGTGSRHATALRSGQDLDHNGFPDVSVIQNEPRGIFNTENHHYVFAETSSPVDLDIQPLSPGPGRVWRGGQTRFVEWTSAVPGSDLGTVILALSTSDGGPPYTFLASGVPNSGRTQVIVPTGTSSTVCRLIYVVTTSTPLRKRSTGPAFTILP